MATAPDSATQLHKAIGVNLRHLREGSGLSQDEVAAHLRHLGLRWDRTIVTRVEKGSRPASLEELVMLAMVLNVGVPDLLPTTGMVALTDGLAITAGALRRVTTVAAPDPVAITETVAAALAPEAVGAAVVRLGHQLAEIEPLLQEIWGGPVPLGVLRAATEDAATDATRKAAAKLTTDPLLVALAAQRLWDRSLPAERESRLDPSAGTDLSPASLRAARGHITRTLINEIRAHLDETQRRSTQ